MTQYTYKILDEIQQIAKIKVEDIKINRDFQSIFIIFNHRNCPIMSYLRSFAQKFLHQDSNSTQANGQKSRLSQKDTVDSLKINGDGNVHQYTYEEIIEQIIKQRMQHLNPMMSISYRAKPLRIKFARGQYLFEQNGNKTLDCINNVSHIGHCHPYYVAKMQKQLNRLLTNSRFLYDELLQATKKILKRFPPELCVVTFANSGSEANDLAMQMAEIHTKKNGIICLDGAYHGITKACQEVSPYKWNQFIKKADHVKVAASPCTYRGFISKSQDPAHDYAEYIDTLIDENTGAFICEYMQSCAGQVIPPRDLYKAVYQKLKAKGVVCIGDEVQTGFGRVGETFWAFEYYGVIPDIVSIGKAMGNGFPVSAVVCTKEIAQSFKKRNVEYFSTYGGNPMAVTAVNAVLDVIQFQNLQQNAKETGHYLREKLEELKKYDFVGDVRGVGLFQGIDIVKSKQSKQQDGQTASKIILLMRQKGCLVSRDGKKANVLKIKPPLIFNKQNVDELMLAFSQVLPTIKN